MKLLYDTATGEILAAVYDVDSFKFSHSINIPFSEFAIDEVDPDNKDLCIDIARNIRKTDVNGVGKYYIETGELYARDGWQEVVYGY